MKTKQQRVFLTEYAQYFGVHRDTIRVWKEKFNKAYKKTPFNPKNMESVFQFYDFLKQNL